MGNTTNIIKDFLKALFIKFLEETGWYNRITTREFTVEELARNPKEYFLGTWKIYLDRYPRFPFYPFVYKVKTISWVQGQMTYTIGYQSGPLLKALPNVLPTAVLRLEQTTDIRYQDYPLKAEIIGKDIVVTMRNGDIISNPLDMHPWLRDADPKKLKNIEYHIFSVWWPDLDEGLDIEGMRRNIPSHKVG